MSERALFKITVLCSLISGGILGFISLIPVLTLWVFIAVMFLTAPFIIIYLKKLNIIKEIKMQQSLIISTTAGLSSFTGFALVYFPSAFILNLIFKIQSFIWVKVLFANFGFLISMVILTALLCSFLNMFAGFLTVYFYLYFKSGKQG